MSKDMHKFGNSPKVLPKYKTKEEISEILDKAKKDRYRNYILLLSLWRTGMRAEEIVKLQKQDIKDKNIIVRQGKGKKDRVVPLESELGNLLGLYSDQLKSRDRLFEITQRQLRNICYKYSDFHEEEQIVEKNGKQQTIIKKVYDVHPHTFRHSFAVYCLKNGMNLRTLQKILGHSSLTVTQIYLDIIGKDIQDDFNKVEW